MVSQWFAPVWPSCVVERFQGGAMVFNPCTNTTHHLNDLALWTMDRLFQGPATSAVLAREMGEETPDSLAAFDRLVQELGRLGLLSPWS